MQGAREFGAEAVSSSEDPLIRLFLLGDPGAIARVEALVAQVVRFRGYYIPHDERPDVIQQAITDLWESVALPGVILNRSFSALVRTVAYRRCVDWMRRQRLSSQVEPPKPDPPELPDQFLLAKEQSELGRWILSHLGEKCQELLRLYTVEDRTYRDIAQLLGRSEGALRVQMHECLKRARRMRDRLLPRRASPNRP